MASTTKIEELVRETFSGLDEGILEYVVSMVEDMDDHSAAELIEVLVPFLMSSEFVDTAEAGEELCRQLSQKIKPPAAAESEPIVKESADMSGLRLLAAPVTIGDVAKVDYSWAGAKKFVNSEAESIGSAVNSRLQKKGKKAAAKSQAVEEKKAAARQAVVANTIVEAPKLREGTKGGGIKDVIVNSMTIAVGGKTLIHDAKLSLVWGRRYGLIGKNGTGKTTLLKAIYEHDIEGFPTNLSMMHVAQEMSGNESCALDVVTATNQVHS